MYAYAQSKVEICGVNTAKLQTLKNDEMRELLDRSHHGDKDARNGNGHIRFRDGIHSRRHNGGVQLNLLCEMSGNVYLTGQYV